MKKEMKLYYFTNDLIKVFTNYAMILDTYFKDDYNQKNHTFLYHEYLELGKQINKVREKHRL